MSSIEGRFLKSYMSSLVWPSLLTQAQFGESNTPLSSTVAAPCLLANSYIYIYTHTHWTNLFRRDIVWFKWRVLALYWYGTILFISQNWTAGNDTTLIKWRHGSLSCAYYNCSLLVTPCGSMLYAEAFNCSLYIKQLESLFVLFFTLFDSLIAN